MSVQIMELPLTLAMVQAWDTPSLEGLVSGFGDFPDAVWDVVNFQFSKVAQEVRISVAVYRNVNAWTANNPLPGFPVVDLRIPYGEFLLMADGDSTLADLITAIRTVSWSLMSTDSRMLRGTPPLGGEEDTRTNAFAAGALQAH